MPLGSLAGHAHVTPTNPEAQAECDRCRFIFNRRRLQWQYQWSGASLVNLGLLVCSKCLDIPQEQFRVLILPGDPTPVPDPRPSPDFTPPAYVRTIVTPAPASLTDEFGTPITDEFGNPIALGPPGIPSNTNTIFLPVDPNNQGFTPYGLGDVPPSGAPWIAAQGTPQVGGYPPGFPTTKAATLAAIAAVTGIPIPDPIFDRSIVFSAASVTQAVMTSQPLRQWFLVFSPAGPISGISKGSAILGSTTTLMVGPGMSWFWADAQGLGSTYGGPLTAVSLAVGMPLWAWESPGTNRILTDEFGVPITDEYGTWIGL